MEASTRMQLTLALIVAAIIILIAVANFVCGQRHRAAENAREPYTSASPATPLAQEAMAQVLVNIRRMRAHGREFEKESAPAPEEPAPAEGKTATLRAAVKSLTGLTQETVSSIGRSPPSQDNYARIYTALRGSDEQTLLLAREFVKAGNQMGGAASPAAAALISLGQEIGYLVNSVHNLGVALDME